MSAQVLLYLGTTLPDNGPSSPVILHRHFTRLWREGWKIAIAHPAGQGRPVSWPDEWMSVPLPARRVWWPPARAGVPGSLAIRRRLLACEIARRLPLKSVSVLVTLLPDYPEEWQRLAGELSRRHGMPHAVIVHDAAENWTESPAERANVRYRTGQRLAKAGRAWFVSERLAKHYGLSGSPNASVLLPIPSAFQAAPPGWNELHAAAPVIAHAGKLFQEYLPALGAFEARAKDAGARLLIVGDPRTPGLDSWRQEHPGTGFQPFLARNEDALAFLRERASALLVFYPGAGCDWAATSFPSKLVEYAGLGLPIIIAAAKDTALRDWAETRQWPALIGDPDTPDATLLIARLRTRAGWESAAAATRAAQEEFSAARIHAQFLAELPQRTPNSRLANTL